YWIISIAILFLLILRLLIKQRLPSFNPTAENQLINILPIAIHITVETLQGFLYIIFFFLVWQLNFFRKVLSVLSYPGKMALSNYIFQSTVCIFIFYSYGLGYYGQLAPIQLIVTATIIFSVQLILS